MIEHHLDLETADGAMNCFITHPEEGGPHPVVFFYMDAPGKREELHDLARRLGTAGYYVILPNLYYRSTREFEAELGNEDSFKQMSDLMMSLSNRKVVSDTAALFAHVDADPAADSSRVGCVGYCMSGPFALSVAAAYTDRIKAAASIYGVRLLVDAPDSPHLGFPTITGELYIACAEHDRWVPPETFGQLQEALAAAGTRGRLEWYPEVHHGFAFPQRPVYDKPAAERHWERLHALFRRNLG